MNRNGALFVLIGKGTFSSAVMNAVTLKRRTNAVFIEEMTGGNINMFGEVRSVILPVTQCEATYSTRYWNTWKGMEGGLVPDIGVPEHNMDLLESIGRPYRVAVER